MSKQKIEFGTGGWRGIIGDDQDGLACINSLPGEGSAVQAGTHDQIIIMHGISFFREYSPISIAQLSPVVTSQIEKKPVKMSVFGMFLIDY